MSRCSKHGIIWNAECDECEGKAPESARGSFAAPAGSATFVIKREVYPENFMGFNEYGFTSWTSYEPDGQRVPADQIAPTMERIQATSHSNSGKLSAHLLPNI